MVATRKEDPASLPSRAVCRVRPRAPSPALVQLAAAASGCFASEPEFFPVLVADVPYLPHTFPETNSTKQNKRQSKQTTVPVERIDSHVIGKTIQLHNFSFYNNLKEKVVI